MLSSRPSPLRHSHPCLSPRFELLRPSVRGTPSPTTHSEGLLLRVGALPCAPTDNRGVVQLVVFNRLGVAQPHECSSKAATCHANSIVCKRIIVMQATGVHSIVLTVVKFSDRFLYFLDDVSISTPVRVEFLYFQPMYPRKRFDLIFHFDVTVKMQCSIL